MENELQQIEQSLAGEERFPIIDPAMEQQAAPQEGQSMDITQALEAELDNLPDEEAAYILEIMTPEFVQGLGVVTKALLGPEIASQVTGYFNQFSNAEKMLLPLPRAEVVKILAERDDEEGLPSTQMQANPQTNKATSTLQM